MTDIRFAPEPDAPIAYIERTRAWYLALGYGNPYAWARYDEVAFRPLSKPLSDSRVALVTTAAPYRPDKGDQGPGAPYNAEAKFYSVYSGDTSVDHDLRVAHVAIDRKHTSMEDSGTWFPLPALRRRCRTRAARCPLSRRADQPQPTAHDRGGRARGSGALRRGQRRRGDPRAQLPGVPPDGEPSRAAPRGERHRDRDHGLR